LARSRTLLLAALATAALLAPAGTAHADSIAFIKRGDVWLADGDGSPQRALTRNGTPRNPYRSPTQADNGTIAALKGRRNVHFFNRRGRQIRRARSVTGGPTPPFSPIAVDNEISPNGRTLATTIWLTTRTQNPKPGQPTGTDYGTTVWYSRASNGRFLGQTRDAQSPSWIGNGQLLVWAPNVYHSADAWIARVGNDQVRPWFQDRAVVDPLDPTDGEPLDDGELTRRRDKLALVRGPNTTASGTPTMVRGYAVSGLEARPTERCDIQAAPNSRIEHPSWHPGGSRLAWGGRGGIWATSIAGGSGDCGASPRLLIRGGSEPDWGRAEMPRRR
jgi:hypothetical protein